MSWTPYAALPSPPDPEDCDSEKKALKWVRVTSQNVLLFGAYAAILISLLSPLLYLSDVMASGGGATTAYRRPSPYVNLEKVTRNSSEQPYPPIYSYSQAVFQIAVNDPSRNLREDTSRERMSNKGYLFPDDRHFLVTKNLTTVIQFRTLDFGMEKCLLLAVLPNPTGELVPAIQLQQASALDIWKLDIKADLTRWKIGQYSAPNRQSLFTWFTFPENGTWSSVEFDCPLLSFNTFEFSCSPMTPDCHVEFWQDRMVPNGIYMKQFDSITGLSKPNDVG